MIAKYDLQKGHQPQKFGLGMKEIWEIDPDKHKEGTVTHTMGWPLGSNAGGGSFIYHLENNQVYIGFVVHLNYKNPHLYPYMEFQRFKHHPMVAELLKGGKRVAYAPAPFLRAAINPCPRWSRPAWRFWGCSVGMVNVPRIKGNHNAMLSGIAAADAAVAALKEGRAADELSAYEEDVRKGVIGKDLKKVRNVKPMWSNGVSCPRSPLAVWICGQHARLLALGTMGHGKTDAEATEPADKHKRSTTPSPMANCPSTG